MYYRLVVLALAATLISIFVFAPSINPASAQATAPGLTLTAVSGTLNPAGQFAGAVTITRVTYRAGALVADGSASGSATTANNAAAEPASDAPAPLGMATTTVTQGFRDVSLTLADPDGGTCDTLTVDLGTIFLDQSGAHLDLGPASLDLETLPPARQPLGYLLCAVASMAEASPTGEQAALLNELLAVVNRALADRSR